MRNKLLATLASILVAAAAVVGLPGSSAGASPSNGDFGGCFKIDKSGNYNHVAAGATVSAKGKDISVHGFVAVAKRCQVSNSIPIHRITIIHARLRDAKTGKVVRLAAGNTSYSKAIVRSTTAPKYAACGHGFYASIKISYAYTDGSYVHPFWVHGPEFTRC